MIKCEVIKEFSLQRFDELKNIQRRRIATKGKLYVGDTFECTKEMADYLMGNNIKGDVVVKVIEIEPEKEDIKLNQFGNPIGTREFVEKPKTTKKKKSSKK